MPATAFLGERSPGQLAVLACTPHSTETAEVLSVVDGTHLGTLPVGTSADLIEAARRARQAQRAWAAMPAYFRLAPFRRFAGLLSSYRGPIADLLHAEAGTGVGAAADLVNRAGSECSRLTRAATRSLRPVRHREGLRVRSVEVRAPHGLVGIVPDPAAPFDPATAAAALVAGNAVVFVAALRCGFTTLLLTELFAASRLPQGLVQVVPGAPELARDAAGVVDHLVVPEPADRQLRETAAGRRIPFSAGSRTDPLEFTTATVVRR